MTTFEHITTAEQLAQAGDLGACELLRGELIMMSPSGTPHSELALTIGSLVRGFVRPRKLGIVTGADGGYLIERDPDTMRAPDVGFVCAERLPPEGVAGFFPGAPDLAVEVNSPNDRASDVLAKVQAWLATGCRMVWVVDAPTKTVTVYQGPRQATILGVGDTLQGGDVLPGFTLPVADVFA